MGQEEKEKEDEECGTSVLLISYSLKGLKQLTDLCQWRNLSAAAPANAGGGPSRGPRRGPTGPKGAHKDGPIKQLAHMIIVDYSAISSGFTDVVTALLLFLTLPVTVATAERSFSKLKLIKNYLRNTMGQERLSGLSLLAIEASQAKTMQTGKLIKRFSDMKARKMKLK